MTPWFACYTVLNEEDYLDTSICSLIHAVDGVVVIHGATRWAPLHHDGRSVDKTGDILANLSARFPGKILVKNVGIVKDRVALRNHYIDEVLDGSWIHVSDADEIWDSKDVWAVREWAQGKNLVEIYVNQMELRHDLFLRAPIRFDRKRDHFFDRRDRPCHDGFIHERIFYKIPKFNIRYRDHHTHVTDHTNRALYADPIYRNRRSFSMIDFWHCGRVCSLDKFKLKHAHLFCQNRYRKPWSDLTEGQKKKELEYGEAEWGETLRRPEKLDRLVRVYGHPEILAAHKYWEMNISQIPRQPIYEIDP